METSAPLRLALGGPSYPTRLAAIEGAPSSLWLRGRTELLEPGRRRVALVGSRSPTPYGTAQALRFGSVLASLGVVVVSGLARGVDQAAHRGALEVGGDTVAVLGSGVSRPWPASPLSEELATRGLLVSEFEPEEGPRRHHFPLRNRVISGLCDAVLVVEAAEASGSLITARWAVDQGREVFALPGRVDHPMSRGAHRLLREGARLVESPEELLVELYPQLETRPEAKPGLADSPLEAALRGETLSADELSERLARPVRSVLGELVALEVEGRVVRAPGGLYRLGVGGR
jgi:DNA processing protein